MVGGGGGGEFYRHFVYSSINIEVKRDKGPNVASVNKEINQSNPSLPICQNNHKALLIPDCSLLCWYLTYPLGRCVMSVVQVLSITWPLNIQWPHTKNTRNFLKKRNSSKDYNRRQVGKLVSLCTNPQRISKMFFSIKTFIDRCIISLLSIAHTDEVQPKINWLIDDLL